MILAIITIIFIPILISIFVGLIKLMLKVGFTITRLIISLIPLVLLILAIYYLFSLYM